MLFKKYCNENYTINEFMRLDNQDLNLLDKFLGNLKKNKKEYARLVFLLAVFLNYNNNIYAESLETGLGDAASEIIHMVLIFGRYGCLGMGIKSMIEEMLQGANIKEATGAGLQYFIFYIILQLYPKLFSMIKF